MSLLLDALRRAGTARGDDIAEPVDRRPVADDHAGERAGPDEFDLDIDAATAAETERTSSGSAATGLNGPARAEAVFRGGASGGSLIRTAALCTLGALALLGGLIVGGWYYYESTRSAVDRELVRYTPDPEPANDRATGTETGGDGAGASTNAGLDPDLLDVATADPEGAGTAATGTSDGDNVDPEVDAAAALAAAPQAESADGSADTAPSGDNAAANGRATTGDAGTAATSTESAAEDAASGSTSAQAAANGDAPGSVEPEQSVSPGAASEERAKATSNEDVRAEAQASDAPMVRSTGSGSGRSPLAEALQEGYRALRSGDLMAARRHYRRAVELDPSNRDARLGAAAVAQRQGNAAAAIEHYRRVLADHPRDPYAHSGLASLESTAEPRQIESELKTLLKQNPNAHALRYALGNLYARENRWSQAQSAYFEAFRAAPKEADYAFNLAVALDQLGQRESAAKYYEQALELAGDGSASFPLESARGRLERLRQ